MPPPDNDDHDDAKLAAKVVAAVKAYDAADAIKKEKAVIVGGLLAEAQKRHPSDKAFEAFLERAGGIQIRRAKDLIAFALGRKDFDKHQADHAAAQQRLRDKQKAEKIEREKAKAALPKPKPDASRDASPKPEPKPKGKGKPEAVAIAPREACLMAVREMILGEWLPKIPQAQWVEFVRELFEEIEDIKAVIEARTGPIKVKQGKAA